MEPVHGLGIQQEAKWGQRKRVETKNGQDSKRARAKGGGEKVRRCRGGKRVAKGRCTTKCAKFHSFQGHNHATEGSRRNRRQEMDGLHGIRGEYEK